MTSAVPGPAFAGCVGLRGLVSLTLLLASSFPRPVTAGEAATDSFLHRAAAAIESAIPQAEKDRARPVFHFRPRANGMGAPAGLIWHRGWYHLFFLQDPFQEVLGRPCWGHARSRDFVRWDHWPPALWLPEDAGLRLGAGGVADTDSEGPLAFFPVLALGAGSDVGADATGLSGPRVGEGSEDLRFWRPRPGPAPLAGVLPASRRADAWRGVSLAAHGSRRFLVCSGRTDEVEGGASVVDLFEARDPALREWVYRGELFRHLDATAGDLGNPLFFSLGDTWLLAVSPEGSGLTEWYAGKFDPDAGGFEPHRRGWLDYSDQFHGAQCFTDGTGRQILLGGVRGFPAPAGRGWSGCLTLPRVLSVRGGVLAQGPAPELEGLRGERQRVRGRRLAGEWTWPEVRGDALEIEAVMERGEASAVGLRLRRSADGRRAVEVRWDGARLEVGGAVMSLFGDLTGNRVEFRIFLDHSCLEVYAAGQCLTRVLPFEPEDDGVSAFAEGTGARVVSLTAWKMASIWP